MSDDHSVDDRPAGPTPVSRRTALGALGAAVVFVSHGFSPHPAVREPIRRKPHVPGWLNDAALDCLFRADENYDGAETALSIVFSGSFGAEPFRLRVAWTDQYESMAHVRLLRNEGHRWHRDVRP